MEIKPLVIGNLSARLPLIQGGMGVGVSLSKLASAVANEGGIGIISAAQPGFNEIDFDTNTKEANIRALKNEIKKAKEMAPGGIIGVNIMVAMRDYESFVQASIEAKADIIISGAGLPINLPKLVKGSDIKIAPIVSSGKAAKVICKMWKERYEYLPDFIVVEGPKAGGIYTGNDIAEFLKLGAAGVQMATRFITTEECDADIEFKNEFLKCSKEDIAYINSPVGMPGRAIKNKFIEDAESGKIKVTKCYGCVKNCNPKTTSYCITKALINSVKGDVDNGLIFSGSNGYKADKIVKVKELVNELVNEIKEA